MGCRAIQPADSQSQTPTQLKVEAAIEIDKLRSCYITPSAEGEEDLCDETEEEDDENGEDDGKLNVILGFVEKPKNRRLLGRELFPSKAGGTPAWLESVDLPYGNFRICDFCREPLQFVLQVYAPISEKDAAFHRTIFVFMCPSMACLRQHQHEQGKRQNQKQSRSVKVFRSQLHRLNPFYSSEPPKYDGFDKPSTTGAALCCWCSTWKGDKVCGRCKTAHYCSEKHQVLHWHASHKMECMQISSHMPEHVRSKSREQCLDLDYVVSKSVWPEFEIVNEEECEGDMFAVSDSVALLCLEDQMARHAELSDKGEENDDERSWVVFEERISRSPGQVLRYCRDVKAKPLWPMSSGKASMAKVPKCNYCGGSCYFEFQIRAS